MLRAWRPRTRPRAADPARQEPRGRQRGAADARAGARGARPARRAQRQHRRRARRVLDLGRRLRAASGRVRRVTCAGTRAPELALRLKYAGIEPQRIASSDDLRRALTPAAADRRRGGRRRGRRRCTRCRHTRRCSRCASCSCDAGTRAAHGVSGSAPRPRTLRVCALYPDLMNIYADRGNLLVLERRCAWRGIGFELAASGLGEPLDPDAHDLFYLGGGQDRDQRLCAEDLLRDQARRRCTRPPREARSCSGCAVAISCSGMPTCSARRRSRGSGLLDVRTVREDRPRLIGNVAIEVSLEGARTRDSPPAVLAGFENHGGRTRLGPRRDPLGRVISGHGNDGRSGYEGAGAGSTIGTYLHGPLLPKNTWFADWLIARALGLRLASCGRSRTRSSARRISARAAPRACEAVRGARSPQSRPSSAARRRAAAYDRSAWSCRLPAPVAPHGGVSARGVAGLSRARPGGRGGRGRRARQEGDSR